MNVQRQYNLPNCTLVLEGLTNNTPTDGSDPRPILSILVNTECRFLGISQKLQGGSSLLENLVKTVSEYAQGYLSGIPHPVQSPSDEDKINLERVPGKNLHRLTWHPSSQTDNPVEMTLTTVQLFDLVEAIDQFVADSVTLPNLTLQLKPLSRRYRPPDEPLAQRAVPATLGIASLVVMAFALFFIPSPEVREPEPDLSVPSTETTPLEENSSESSPQ
ncbi:DUF4335 domain-containing protein [Crocosphaera watsonii WH 8501]|uniref:DUF4335 domain-containing protein n=6 Tax=Crocosphaera watsonii TaxID=263511 RepID=Q4C3U2_CROWT|nr:MULTISPECIES: DUF4335 domain-containing protein [Crocosphaera]EAM50836.1 hypothetical protein CwatDRAFT_3915 [Crocosphaera watsonii WH 8501]EHJ12761.1 hypothetical protein CWATWH0003_2538 [Crocosphaera watsonii WH 0003]MCH2246328.1 DUF4335 domain-containing protein [Crocosphaera sp.]NQZ62203.1 DUF4335 domain-containing protein [Crocosphaera sp.]CCQ49614.1 FIG00566078: hypothetical protein [Crocosphaera watsonii WH 8502]